MHTILLCGGSGQRLWPLSNRVRSKMFLEMLPAPDGGTESMIGRVSRQVSHCGLGESCLFVAHQDQIALTRRYTENRYPVIGEPEKRGTFTAAALGALHLYSTGKAKPDDILCVAPADMFADDDFFQLFHQFKDILAKSQAELVLLGTRPTHPSDQYGYIVTGREGGDGYRTVIRFEEKPDLPRAQELVREHALWNCGVFAFSLRFMLAHLEERGLPLELAEFTDSYPAYPVRSFDQEVAERSSNAVVIRHEGTWRDLGSWETMSDQLRVPLSGQGGIWGDCRNTHIVNELNIPLHVIGVSGIVAVSSPEGILIADKQSANIIKEILQDVSSIPRYGETGWGSYVVLDRILEGSKIILTLKLSLLPDHSIPERQCLLSSKSWIILSGHGEATLNGAVIPAQTGGILTIASGEWHGIKAFTTMELIEVRMGEQADEELIYD